ncbi:MAG: HvfA family oxazolone/thioamide-modified RiPP metallophore [Nevskiaceae bacterium]
MSKFPKKPLALALGAAFTLTGMGAQASVFQVAELASGYMVAQATPATPAKPAEGKGDEAKCGANCMKAMKDKGKTEAESKAHCDKMAKEGKCGGDKKGKEGKCGEGKCGGDKAKAKDKDKEGKCGEGKCGGKH